MSNISWFILIIYNSILDTYFINIWRYTLVINPNSSFIFLWDTNSLKNIKICCRCHCKDKWHLPETSLKISNMISHIMYKKQQLWEMISQMVILSWDFIRMVCDNGWLQMECIIGFVVDILFAATFIFPQTVPFCSFLLKN